MALATVDGGHARTVDLSAGSGGRPTALFTLTGLSKRVHTVKITVLGRKRAGATGTAVTLDRLVTG